MRSIERALRVRRRIQISPPFVSHKSCNLGGTGTERAKLLGKNYSPRLFQPSFGLNRNYLIAIGMFVPATLVTEVHGPLCKVHSSLTVKSDSRMCLFFNAHDLGRPVSFAPPPRSQIRTG